MQSLQCFCNSWEGHELVRGARSLPGTGVWVEHVGVEHTITVQENRAPFPPASVASERRRATRSRCGARSWAAFRQRSAAGRRTHFFESAVADSHFISRARKRGCETRRCQTTAWKASV